VGEQGPTRAVIAIDPGREKCGVAVVTSHGTLVAKSVVAVAGLVALLEQLLQAHQHPNLIVGDGTGSHDVCQALQAAFPDVRVERVSECRSTERALARWRETVRPRGWQKLLPRPFRFPGAPIDDFAAWILAEDHVGRA